MGESLKCLSLQTVKNCRKDDLPGPIPLSLAWLSPSNSFFQPHWATSSSHWSFCWFQIEGGGEALAVLSSKYHNSRGGKQIWNTTRDWNVNVTLHKSLWKKESTRFTFVSRSNYKHVTFNSTCKWIFFNQMKTKILRKIYAVRRKSPRQIIPGDTHFRLSNSSIHKGKDVRAGPKCRATFLYMKVYTMKCSKFTLIRNKENCSYTGAKWRQKELT